MDDEMFPYGIPAIVGEIAAGLMRLEGMLG
jgi:hypothetical protein